MIGPIELDILIKRLEKQCTNAITAHMAIDTIKRQTKEITQFNEQLSNCQRECDRLRKLK